MAVTQTIYLTQTSFRVPQVVHAVQNDSGRILKMVIEDESLQAGDTAELLWKRSDGTCYSAQATLDLVENAFVAEDIQQALTQTGMTACQLKVTRSGLRVSAYTFKIDVQPSVAGIPEEQLDYDIKDVIDAAIGAEQGVILLDVRVSDVEDFVEDASPRLDQLEANMYTKPSGGIPKTDLASDVQTSLGKADTALQSVPATYRTAAAQDLIDGGKQDAPLVGQAWDSSGANHVTPTQVFNALKSGRDANITYVDANFGLLHFDAWNIAESAGIIASQTIITGQSLLYCYLFVGDLNANTWSGTATVLATEAALSRVGFAVDDLISGQQPAGKTISIPFGQVDSTSTATAFTATVDGITELRDGVCVYLKNGVATSASGCTLNINNLGAKPIYQTMAAASATTTAFNVNYTMLFVYNSSRVTGGCWDMFYGYNANTTYSAMSITEANTGTATSARTMTASVLHQKINNVLNTKVPDVTTADNGKFLRVVNGAWTAATIPSAESEAY